MNIYDENFDPFECEDYDPDHMPLKTFGPIERHEMDQMRRDLMGKGCTWTEASIITAMRLVRADVQKLRQDAVRWAEATAALVEGVLKPKKQARKRTKKRIKRRSKRRK